MKRIAVLFVLLVGSPVAQAATIDIPGDYTTIQQGVYASQSGDTVYVHAGTYNESVDLGNSIHLIGEDPRSTIIIGDFHLWAVRIGGFSNTVSGFTITGEYRCIWLVGSNCIITGNILSGGGIGVFIGQHLEASPVGHLPAKTMGLVYGPGGAPDGRFPADGNVISDNRITNNAYGILFFGYDSRPINNTIKRNAIVGNTTGIAFQQHVDSNLIVENTIALNSYRGIASESVPSDNFIYHNDFLRNPEHAYDEGSNIYHSDSLETGNFWSDYDGDDDDGDGIGDEPYYIAGADNSDAYPLMIKFTDPCGDVTLDGQVDIDDVVALIWLVMSGGGRSVTCYMDANGSGAIDIDDVVYLIAFVFSLGSPPIEDCCSEIW
jgi:nitrous oxidase accessory protein NosD